MGLERSPDKGSRVQIFLGMVPGGYLNGYLFLESTRRVGEMKWIVDDV
ncbi:MAG: hypothetical protein HQL62_02480 [Magnetococcales bacterium]|nr:hypothetical protein [Magnetococcales bacterium]